MRPRFIHIDAPGSRSYHCNARTPADVRGRPTRGVFCRFPFSNADARLVWKFLKIAGVVAATLVLVLGLLALITWRATKAEVPWYTEAVADVEPEALAKRVEAGDELERHALELRNEARHTGAWEAVFTQEQINGWLASDLQEKFPDMLPDYVHNPRVKIDRDFARAAFRVSNSQIDAVIVVGVDLYLTENSNELAVRFRDARAGLVPLPLKHITDVAGRAAQKTNIELQWKQNSGDPVALIKIPEQVEDVQGRLIVENIEVRDGEVYLSGRTVKPDGSGGSTNVQRVIVGQLFRSETLQR